MRTVAKASIEELRRPDQSIMPSFREQLTSDDIADLISYVVSLQQQ